MAEKNCSTCTRWVSCKKLDGVKEYQDMSCEEYKSRYIEFPIQVSSIKQNDEQYTLNKRAVGKFVRIKPCAKEHNGQTFLGLFLGDLPCTSSVNYREDSQELTVRLVGNPAIFVFDLNKVVYGLESWWSVIESEKDLRDITKTEINEQWYVKALKMIES